MYLSADAHSRASLANPEKHSRGYLNTSFSTATVKPKLPLVQRDYQNSQVWSFYRIIQHSATKTHTCANISALGRWWVDGGWLQNFNISPNPNADTLLVAQKQQQHQNEGEQAAGVPELASHTRNLRNVAWGVPFIQAQQNKHAGKEEEKMLFLLSGQWWDSDNESQQQQFLQPLRNSAYVCHLVCVCVSCLLGRCV